MQQKLQMILSARLANLFAQALLKVKLLINLQKYIMILHEVSASTLAI